MKTARRSGPLESDAASAALGHALLARSRSVLLALGGLLPGWSHAGFSGEGILLSLGAVTCSAVYRGRFSRDLSADRSRSGVGLRRSDHPARRDPGCSG